MQARVVNLFTITVKFPFLDLKGVETWHGKLYFIDKERDEIQV